MFAVIVSKMETGESAISEDISPGGKPQGMSMAGDEDEHWWRLRSYM